MIHLGAKSWFGLTIVNHKGPRAAQMVGNPGAHDQNLPPTTAIAIDPNAGSGLELNLDVSPVDRLDGYCLINGYCLIRRIARTHTRAYQLIRVDLFNPSIDARRAYRRPTLGQSHRGGSGKSRSDAVSWKCHLCSDLGSMTTVPGHRAALSLMPLPRAPTLADIRNAPPATRALPPIGERLRPYPAYKDRPVGAARLLVEVPRAA
jgi:hypothetical protein